MSRLKISLLTVVVSCIVTLLGLHLVDRTRNREVASLRATNDQLRFEAGLRRHASFHPAAPPLVVEAKVPEVASGGRRDETSEPKHASDRVVVADYRNEGSATPQAALQTLAWTGDRGDPEELARLIVLDPAAHRRAQTYFDSLPADVRGKAGTVDRLAAVELTASIIHRPFPRAVALEQATVETVGEDRVALLLPGSIRDRMEFQRTGDGWKYVITEAMVNAFLAARGAAAD